MRAAQPLRPLHEGQVLSAWQGASVIFWTQIAVFVHICGVKAMSGSKASEEFVRFYLGACLGLNGGWRRLTATCQACLLGLGVQLQPTHFSCYVQQQWLRSEAAACLQNPSHGTAAGRAGSLHFCRS